jgi:hypothetical protein
LLCSLSICWKGRIGGDVEKLVERAVTEALRDGGGEALRLYVAACTDRMAPLFVGLRAGEPGREADLISSRSPVVISGMPTDRSAT